MKTYTVALTEHEMATVRNILASEAEALHDAEHNKTLRASVRAISGAEAQRIENISIKLATAAWSEL